MRTFDVIFVSALTSALVALGIEWLAKPSLEARKERILDARRSRSDFARRMWQIMVLAAQWKDVEIPAGAAEAARPHPLAPASRSRGWCSPPPPAPRRAGPAGSSPP